MTEKKQSEQALDALEERLNLSRARARKQYNGEQDPTTKTSSTSNDVVDEPKESFIAKILTSCKAIIAKVDDDKREKVKKFATSNLGITIIVIGIFLALFGVHILRHHHAVNNSESASNAWNNTAVSTKVTAPTSPVNTTKTITSNQLVATNTDSSFASEPQLQVNQITQKLDDLSVELKNTNQRLMVISKILLQKNNTKKVISGNYQILGWRLDQDTNQWIADIEYNGQVKAYYPGQRFGSWTVRSVTANGVEIK